jgi:hypothetical protein
MIVGATSRVAIAQDPEGVNDLAHAGRQKRLAGTMLLVGGSALVVTGVGLTIAGFASDDRTRCRGSGGYFYYSSNGGRDGSLDNSQCWNQSLVLAGGATWLVGAVTLGVGIPVYLIGVRQLREAARLRRWFQAPPPPPAYPPPPPGFAPPPPPR